MPKTYSSTHKRHIIIAMLLTALMTISATTLVAHYAYSQSFSSPGTTYGPGDVDAYSYTIFKEGSTYYAKNGTTRAIQFSDSNAITVIQNTYDTLTNGGSVYFKRATYEFVEHVIWNYDHTVTIFEDCVFTTSVTLDAFFGTKPFFDSVGTVDDLEICGKARFNGNNLVSYGLGIRNVTRFVMNGFFEIENVTTTGYWFEHVSDAYIHGLLYYGNTSSVQGDDSNPNVAIRFHRSTYINLDYSRIYYGGNLEEHYGSFIITESSHSTFTDVKGYQGDAIVVSGTSSKCLDLDFVNVEMKYGLGGTTAFADGFDVVWASYVTFTNCRAYYNNSTGWSIETVYGNQTIDNILLENCIAKGNGGAGFVVTQNATRVQFSNCIGEENGEGTSGYQKAGIYISDTEYIEVDGGFFYGSSHQDYGIAEVGTSNYNMISNVNTRDSVTMGIHIVGASTFVTDSWNSTTWIA